MTLLLQVIGTDPFLRLHTFHNLALLLKGGVPGVSHTLRDHSLEVRGFDLSVIVDMLDAWGSGI